MFKPSSSDEDLARFEIYLPHLPRGLPPWELAPNTAPGEEPHPNDKKALFIAEITAFAGRAKRIRDAIEREDLAKSADRPRILRLALVEGIALYYRAHPNADAAPGVFALIIVLADNDEYGACYLSMTRLAQILNRTVECIRGAIKRLDEDGLIGVEDRGEKGETKQLLWPLAHPSFGEGVSPFWLIDAFSPEPLRRGRPRKPLPPWGEPLFRKTPPP